MSTDLTLTRKALDGELIDPRDWREADDRYGVGDYVTREGSDVLLVISLNGPQADAGEFRCVVAPQSSEDDPWIRIGETEFNLTRRYDPVRLNPSQRVDDFEDIEPGDA